MVSRMAEFAITHAGCLSGSAVGRVSQHLEGECFQPLGSAGGGAPQYLQRMQGEARMAEFGSIRSGARAVTLMAEFATTILDKRLPLACKDGSGERSRQGTVEKRQRTNLNASESLWKTIVPVGRERLPPRRP